MATYRMNRWMGATWALLLALLASGCVKGKQAYHHAERAETAGNYDSALQDYQAALQKDPQNARFKLKTYQMRFEASQLHVRLGLKHLEQKENEAAVKEFETALEIDPSCMVAQQELEYTRKLMGSGAPAANVPGKTGAVPSPSAPAGANPAAPAPQEAGGFINRPPSLAPLSREPVTLKMNEDARIVFRTIGKLAGVNVIFDPDFPDKKISIDLVNVTIQQALQVACVEAKAFWKPVTSNIILVLPDNSAKRRQEEEQILKKIYLEHTQTPQELTEIATGVQQMLELRHVQPVARDNAILIRDTPEKILLASRLIQDSDRGRAEVVVQISVLQVRRDRARSLGIQPGGATTLAFVPPTPLGPAGAVALNKLGDISSGDFALTLPNAVAAALMSDSSTRIIQNPEVRVSDGESARLRVGDRVPVATGSFQATAGLGPVVNTQFQYIDVGVNIDLSPHVHPDHSVSMKLSVEVSSLNGKVNIGGIDQPVISQRRIEHDIRLQEGEVSILGGLAERHQTKSVTGWPGLSHLPLLRYLFSGEDVNNSENEVLIVVTPRLVRSRELTQERLQALSIGTDSEISLRQQDDVQAPAPASGAVKEPWADAASITPAPDGQTEHPPILRLLPESVSIKPGETASIQVQMENMEDLFSASLMFRYDPRLLAVEDVQHGDFLSGGTQEVAIIQRIDKDKGQAGIFTTRQPNTAGVSGKGILLGLVVRRLAEGPASLELVEAGTRNSRQRILPVKIERGSVSLP